MGNKKGNEKIPMHPYITRHFQTFAAWSWSQYRFLGLTPLRWYTAHVSTSWNVTGSAISIPSKRLGRLPSIFIVALPMPEKLRASLLT